MFPRVVVAHSQVYLDEWAPLRALGLANQVQAGFLRGAIGLPGITLDAGTNDILPSGWAAAVARDDVVEVQITAIKDFATILAGVVIAFENVVARKFYLLLRHAIEKAEQNDARHADTERNRVDTLRVRLLVGEVVPLREIVGLERAICIVQNDLGMAFKKQREGAPGGADVHSLPEPV